MILAWLSTYCGRPPAADAAFREAGMHALAEAAALLLRNRRVDRRAFELVQLSRCSVKA
jgi:hypothetical protein